VSQIWEKYLIETQFLITSFNSINEVTLVIYRGNSRSSGKAEDSCQRGPGFKPPAEETIFHAPFIWIKLQKNIYSPGTVACAVILLMEGRLLWMVYICTKAMNDLWVNS
jgi:hypothetical protein